MSQLQGHKRAALYYCTNKQDALCLTAKCSCTNKVNSVRNTHTHVFTNPRRTYSLLWRWEHWRPLSHHQETHTLLITTVTTHVGHSTNALKLIQFRVYKCNNGWSVSYKMFKCFVTKSLTGILRVPHSSGPDSNLLSMSAQSSQIQRRSWKLFENLWLCCRRHTGKPWSTSWRTWRGERRPQRGATGNGLNRTHL